MTSSSSSSCSPIHSLINSLLKDASNNWSSAHDKRLLKLLHKIHEDITHEKSSSLELKMKHLHSISEKVNVRLNACKIGLGRMGSSIGVERKVEDVSSDEEEEEEEESEEETVEERG